ncbi:hypothetical protein [Variovorax sp. HJSM1_2]|uniref:hypothetical protein n=1 Tax=Variovorax sp. HJSM1_2 TaxID=3366263 RepID=UPI003BC68FBF
MPPLPQRQLTEFTDAECTPGPATQATGSVPELLRVRQRQSQMLYWPAGTQLLVLRGSVRLTETPQWHGETLLRTHVEVHAHSGHTVDREGWVLLLALADAVVRVQCPASAVALSPFAGLSPRSFWQQLRGWRGWLGLKLVR